jgi:ATPase subunit of ABC transporter with duplicated ATPase domains
LDEPTNHLDLEAIEALVTALKGYDGSLVFVSHDRWFVSELATRIIEITREGINDFPGTYEEYLARSGDDHLDSQAVLRQARATKRKARANPGENRKSRSGPSPARKLKKIDAQLVELTERVAVAEARIEALNAQFCQENYYKNTPPEENAALQAEQRMLTEEVRLFMVDWEALEQQGEELREEIEASA